MQVRPMVWLVLGACGRETASPPPAIVINEVAPRGAGDDWFEVLNPSGHAVALDELVFVDRRGDFVRADRMDAVVLAPGTRHVQVVTRAENGFALGDGDELWLYTFDERALVDVVTWRRLAVGRGDSLARVPDGVGTFVVHERPTPGAPNR